MITWLFNADLRVREEVNPDSSSTHFHLQLSR